MSEKIHIGVIYGGRSGEHEVSVRSACAVIENIDRAKYDVTPLAITREGRWLSPAESAAMLPEAVRGLLPQAVNESAEALTIVGDPSHRGLLAIDGDERGRDCAGASTWSSPCCTARTARTGRFRACWRWPASLTSAAACWLRAAAWTR